MEILDITFDLETSALCPTAGVFSWGAVAWDRTSSLNSYPFLLTESGEVEKFSELVDGTTCFLEGLTFDPETSRWWKNQSEEAKKALIPENPYLKPALPIRSILDSFLVWVNGIAYERHAKSVCLWCQGSDFDIAIMRNIAYILNEQKNVDKTFKYTNFRDCRTYILENGSLLLDNPAEGVLNTKLVYNQIPKIVLPESDKIEQTPHSPLYDAIRSTWSTWWVMKNISAKMM